MATSVLFVLSTVRYLEKADNSEQNVRSSTSLRKNSDGVFQYLGSGVSRPTLTVLLTYAFDDWRVRPIRGIRVEEESAPRIEDRRSYDLLPS